MENVCKDITSFLVMDILEKAHELERQGKSVIHLEIGEPDFDTPECVKEAARKAVTDGRTHYTHSLGLPLLREAIADLYHREYGVSVDPGRIVVTAGASPALLLAFSALLRRGDEVMLTDPCYACYPNFARYLGAVPAYVPVSEEDGFQFRPEVLAKRLTAKTRAVVVNSPSNPAGTLAPAETLAALARLGPAVVSDEIYHGLVYQGKARSALEFSDDCLVVNGFSKRFAMTGFRLGYLIAPAGLVPAIQRLQQNFFICACSVSQWAGLAALTEAAADVERMVATYDERRRFLIAGLKRLGFTLRNEPVGAFYVLVNAKNLHHDSLALAYDILDKVQLGVTPGVDFGPGGEGHLRFSYANSLENIAEGLARLERYLNEHCRA